MAAPVSPNVVVKWNGKEYTISDIVDTDTVHDLKCMISKQTGVMPERQKLIGLKLKVFKCRLFFIKSKENCLFIDRP